MMILLTVYTEKPAGMREKRAFARMQDAIEFGQETGSDYEIYDPVTGKVTDWNEINVREDEEWYYDDTESLWKKFKPEDDFVDGFPTGDFHYEKLSQNCNLRCA